MKFINKNDPSDQVDASQFNLIPSEHPRPCGLMLFDDGWNIDGNNGRFIIKPGEWLLRRKGNNLEVITTEELHTRFRRDSSQDKITISRELLEEVRGVSQKIDALLIKEDL